MPFDPFPYENPYRNKKPKLRPEMQFDLGPEPPQYCPISGVVLDLPAPKHWKKHRRQLLVIKQEQKQMIAGMNKEFEAFVPEETLTRRKKLEEKKMQISRSHADIRRENTRRGRMAAQDLEEEMIAKGLKH